MRFILDESAEVPLDSTADQKIASIGELLSTRSSDVGKFIVLTARGPRVGDENA